jgi:hypothetical protein
MTEQEWLMCADPTPMYWFLRAKIYPPKDWSLQSKISPRKGQLFALACCRRIWHLLDEGKREKVERAERSVDNRIVPSRGENSAHGIQCNFPDYHMVETVVRLAVDYATHPYPDPDGAARNASGALAWGFAGSNRLVNGLDSAQHISDAERRVQAQLFRDICGNPFRTHSIDEVWLDWNGGTIRALSHTISDEAAFDLMPILADAVEDAGCDNAEILEHCRGPGPHVLGCWVLDLLLAKE